jgi:hypothetical protein
MGPIATRVYHRHARSSPDRKKPPPKATEGEHVRRRTAPHGVKERGVVVIVGRRVIVVIVTARAPTGRLLDAAIRPW